MVYRRGNPNSIQSYRNRIQSKSRPEAYLSEITSLRSSFGAESPREQVLPNKSSPQEPGGGAEELEATTSHQSNEDSSAPPDQRGAAEGNPREGSSSDPPDQGGSRGGLKRAPGERIEVEPPKRFSSENNNETALLRAMKTPKIKTKTHSCRKYKKLLKSLNSEPEMNKEQARKAFDEFAKSLPREMMMEFLLGEEEFQTIKNGARPPPAPVPPPTEVSNPFSVLPEEGEEEMVTEEEPQRLPWQEVSRNRRPTAKAKESEPAAAQPSSEPTPTPKAPKPPAILSSGINTKEFDAMLATLNIQVKYKMLPGGALKIFTQKREDHQTIMGILSKANQGGFSFTPKEDRKALLIMKDIHSSVDIKDVAAEIEEQTGLKPTIKRMETSKSKEKGFVLNSIIVSTEESKAREIKKIKYIANHVIRWENFRKNVITQCFRCQQFGHAAKNCLNPYNCVKCDKRHEPGLCQLAEKVENEKLYCYNCQEMGHPASYRGCPKYVKVLEKIEEQQKRKEELRQGLRMRREMAAQSANRFVTDVPYSEMLKGQPAYQQPTQQQQPYQGTAPTGGFLNGEFNKHFGKGMMEVIEQTRAFTPYYKSLSDEMDKKTALIQFAMSLCE